MRAAVFKEEGQIGVEDIEKPELESSGDALVRVTHTAICGSDLWFFRGEREQRPGSAVGHEPMGVVEEVGDDVTSIEPGDRVLAPFSISCGRCEYCRKGLQTSCADAQFWGGSNGGAQGEYVRCPHADGTLVKVPDHVDDEDTLRSLLPLTDVMGTGHHAAVSARVEQGDTAVVIGDGAVGLCAVHASRRLGARKIVAVGHHENRLEVAREMGATHTVSAEGEDAVDQVLELTGGGSDHVAECVGASSSLNQAAEIANPGGTVGYVGAPYGVDNEFSLFQYFGDNIELRGGIAPVREYMPELMEDVLQGTLDPSRVFTKEVALENIQEGYEAMDSREEIKVLVKP